MHMHMATVCYANRGDFIADFGSSTTAQSFASMFSAAPCKAPRAPASGFDDKSWLAWLRFKRCS